MVSQVKTSSPVVSPIQSVLARLAALRTQTAVNATRIAALRAAKAAKVAAAVKPAIVTTTVTQPVSVAPVMAQKVSQ